MTDQVRPIQDSSFDKSSHSFTFPNALMALDVFSLTEKMILKKIISLSSKYFDKGGCSLSNDCLAEDHNCSKSTVGKTISKAEWLGFVKKREDTINEYELKNGTKAISQIRRLIMVVPPFYEMIGELWADGYHTGDKDSKNIVKQINIELKAIIEERTDRSESGIEAGEIALVRELLDEDGLSAYLDYKKEKEDIPSLEFTIPHSKNLRYPLFKIKELLTLSLSYSFFKELKNSLSVFSKTDLEPSEEKDSLPDKKLPAVSNQDILSAWNKMAESTGLKTIPKITPHRREKIKTRSKTFKTFREWRRLFAKVAASAFLCGDNNRGWQCEFDWIIDNDDNPDKVMEGKYENKVKSPTKSKNLSCGSGDVDGKYDNSTSYIIDSDTGEEYLKGSPEYNEWIKTKSQKQRGKK